MRTKQNVINLRQQDISEEVMRALREGLGGSLVAAVLFGSRARGDAGPDSDWDILVLAEELPAHPWERHKLLKRLIPAAFRGSVSILAKTPDEFEGHLPALYLDIALDGRILYDPRRYAFHLMEALRHTIEKAGLYRERTADGDIWQWRNPPKGSWSVRWEP
ncbi:MAG: nucleotidyltransferase domain-containing protein [Dehalococcoidia bacterium]|nr:nucleotidyltransferase domain-containing protein [Dehalococcoidia bacterium]